MICTPTIEQAKEALRRYNKFVSTQLSRTHWSLDNRLAGRDYIQRSRWIDARRQYLQAILTAAVRDDPSKSL